MSLSFSSPSNLNSTTVGILPSQEIRSLIDRGHINCHIKTLGILENQIQPASLDLRFGSVAYRCRTSFLPGLHQTVYEKLEQSQLYQIDLTEGAIFEKNCVYLVPLLEKLSLPSTIRAFANPKSSTGRLDVFARLITDYGVAFDQVTEGYEGALWAEICPHAF